MRASGGCCLSIIIPSYYGNENGDGERLQQHYWVQLLAPAFLALKSLVLDAAERIGASVRVEFYEERLQAGDKYLYEIIRQQRKGEQQLVFLSCKSMELSRGIDIAVQLKRAGIGVVMGGPGVTLSDWKTYQFLYAHGISFNIGEGESTVRQIVQDFLEGRLRSCYVQEGYVDLAAAPMPSHPRVSDLRGTVGGYIGLSTSEGCPFDCSYCSEWILRGRQTRARDPEAVADWVEQAHRRFGYYRFFITDDNFRRSPRYHETVELLTKLNGRMGQVLRFMAQVDVKNVIREVPGLAGMGVKRVFVGMESPDPIVIREVLKKRQNDPSKYKETVDAFHARGILVDTGWMVGFPNQTREMILEEADYVSRLVDFAYPFCTTPLQGTVDHSQAVADGTIRTWDPNNYDTRRPVRDWFQRASIEEIGDAYNEAFFRLFSVRNITGGGHPGLRGDRFSLRFLARALAEGGRRVRGVPFHFMMEGWPRRSEISRPHDSFRGFPLTPEDVTPARKEQFLASLGARFEPAGSSADTQSPFVTIV
jgi:hypothetical protein